MNWFWLALVAILLNACNTVGSKKLLASRAVEPGVLLIVYRVITAIVLWIYFFASGNSFADIQLTSGIVFVFILNVFAFSIANLLYYQALKRADLSEVVLIMATQPFIAVGMGTFFSEPPTLLKIIAGVASFSAIASLYTHEKHRIHWRFGHTMALGAVIIFTIGGFSDKFLVLRLPLLHFTMVGITANAVAIAAIGSVSLRQVRDVMRGRQGVVLFGLGLLLLASALLYLQAYVVGGQVSQMLLLSYAGTAITVIAGIMLFKEQKQILHKLAVAAVIFLSLLLVYRS